MAVFGRRGLELMQILWKHGDQTAQEIRERVKDDIADPTVRTMLRILEEKGAVTHTKRGRAFIYKPKVQAKTTLKEMLNDIVDGFFDGNASELVQFMVDERIITPQALGKVKKGKKSTATKKSGKGKKK